MQLLAQPRSSIVASNGITSSLSKMSTFLFLKVSLLCANTMQPRMEQSQLSLELFNLLNQKPDELPGILADQEVQIQRLQEKYSSLSTQAYIQTATLQASRVNFESLRNKLSRKANAAILKEFRDHALLSEKQNFKANFSSDDILNQSFFVQSQQNAQQADFDVNLLFRLADQRIKELERRNEVRVASDLAPKIDLDYEIDKAFHASRRELDYSDVFSACYIEKVAFNTDLATAEQRLSLGEQINQQLTHRCKTVLDELTQLRIAKIKHEQFEAFLAEQLQQKAIIVKNIRARIQLAENYQECIQKQLDAQQSRNTKRGEKKSYPKPWRNQLGRQGGALEARELQLKVQQIVLAWRFVKKDIESAKLLVEFYNRYNYSDDKLLHYLFFETAFFKSIRALLDAQGITAARDDHFFITE